MYDLGMKIHHIAYATRDTDKAIEAFKFIFPGIEYYKILEESQNVYFSYLVNSDKSLRLELVEPAKSPSPVDNMLSNVETALYHICYEVDNFREGCELLRSRGFIAVSKPFRPTFNHSICVCHFYSEYTNIIEIIGPAVNAK